MSWIYRRMNLDMITTLGKLLKVSALSLHIYEAIASFFW